MKIITNMAQPLQLTEIKQMHDGMQQTICCHQHPGQFMQVDVLIQWQKRGKSSGPEKCDTLPQHQYQDEGAVKVETLTWKW